MKPEKRIHGKGKQICVQCNRRSVSGRLKGEGLCPYHWARYIWGQDWADTCYLPEHADEMRIKT